jgi:hypothetical protein
LITIQLYLVHHIYVYEEAATENRTIGNSFTWHLVFFKKLAYFLPEDGTCVPKHVGETHQMYVLIRNCVWLVYLKRCTLKFIAVHCSERMT